MQQHQFQFKGPINKENKKIFDNIQKIKRGENFYICAIRGGKKVDFLYLGKSDTHHFSLQVEQLILSIPMVVLKVDLDYFKQAIQQFRSNMTYCFKFEGAHIQVEADMELTTPNNTYTYLVQNLIPISAISPDDEETVNLVLNLPVNNTLLKLEFNNANQFKMLANQAKALKLVKITFELIPEQTSIRVQSVYDAGGTISMKFIFNNYKINYKNITERERFTFDAEEFITSVQMMTRESNTIFLLTSNGSLLLTEDETLIQNTKSILQRIIVNQDF